MAKKPIVAIMYDFDKTLSTKDMQEFNFISNVGMKPQEFWNEVAKMSKDYKMDNILAYMYLMIKMSNRQECPIHRHNIVKLGEGVEYYPGVEDWFKRINKYGDDHGAKIEHFIISSGITEIIEGTSIAKEFEKIFACEFHYDQNDVADWPKNVVNYTTKTQFVYRINKGALDLSDNDTVNKYVPDSERPIPFSNMIYIGDGLTDVPCMKVVKTNGGHSIAVFPSRHKEVARNLILDGRVNFMCQADYSEGKELDKTVKAIIDSIVSNDTLNSIQSKHQTNANKECKNKETK